MEGRDDWVVSTRASGTKSIVRVRGKPAAVGEFGCGEVGTLESAEVSEVGEAMRCKSFPPKKVVWSADGEAVR